MTTPKQPAPIARKSHQDQGLVEIRRTFTFLTPLFGGGVWVDPDENTRHVKKYDDITPARGTAIRGQLRFWWRATHGLRPPTDGRPHNIATLREREDALWGNASLVGKVNLRVESQRLTAGSPVEIFEVNQSAGGKWNPRSIRGKENLAYGAFPLQPKAGLPTKPSPGALQPIVGQATIVLTYTPSREQTLAEAEAEAKGAECAVDAWLTFGGLGGRTRRGFGALKADSPKDPQALFNEIQALGLQALQGVAGFAGATLAIRQGTHANALNALETALGRLRQFRQGDGTARTPRGGNPSPGRSWWPEAESIRHITGQSDPKHAMPLVALGRDVFPRAAFGMPIIFHFKDNNSRTPNPRNTDPSDTTLMPVDAERRASPLILRPFYSTSNNTHKTMALVLRDPAMASEQYRLHPVADNVSTKLTGQEAAHLTRNPQPLPLNNETDVLAAFLSFFQQ